MMFIRNTNGKVIGTEADVHKCDPLLLQHTFKKCENVYLVDSGTTTRGQIATMLGKDVTNVLHAEVEDTRGNRHVALRPSYKCGIIIFGTNKYKRYKQRPLVRALKELVDTAFPRLTNDELSELGLAVTSNRTWASNPTNTNSSHIYLGYFRDRLKNIKS